MVIKKSKKYIKKVTKLRSILKTKNAKNVKNAKNAKTGASNERKIKNKKLRIFLNFKQYSKMKSPDLIMLMIVYQMNKLI